MLLDANHQAASHPAAAQHAGLRLAGLPNHSTGWADTSKVPARSKTWAQKATDRDRPQGTVNAWWMDPHLSSSLRRTVASVRQCCSTQVIHAYDSNRLRGYTLPQALPCDDNITAHWAATICCACNTSGVNADLHINDVLTAVSLTSVAYAVIYCVMRVCMPSDDTMCATGNNMCTRYALRCVKVAGRRRPARLYKVCHAPCLQQCAVILLLVATACIATMRLPQLLADATLFAGLGTPAWGQQLEMTMMALRVAGCCTTSPSSHPRRAHRAVHTRHRALATVRAYTACRLPHRTSKLGCTDTMHHGVPSTTCGQQHTQNNHTCRRREPCGGGAGPRSTQTRLRCTRDETPADYWLRMVCDAYNRSGGLVHDAETGKITVDRTVLDACQQAWAATGVQWASKPTLTRERLANRHATDSTYQHGMHMLRPDWARLTDQVSNVSPMAVLHATGDGNCFFNSVSILLQGDEDLHMLLRLHTAIEVLLHLQKYLCGPAPIYCRHVRNMNAGDTSDLVRSDADKYIMELLQGHGTWVTAQQAVPLASVLKRDVHVFSPLNTNTDTMFVDASMHTDVRGAEQANLPITLAWTHTAYKPRNRYITCLNHFVPVAGSAATHTSGALFSPRDRAAGVTVVAATQLLAPPTAREQHHNATLSNTTASKCSVAADAGPNKQEHSAQEKPPVPGADTADIRPARASRTAARSTAPGEPHTSAAAAREGGPADAHAPRQQRITSFFNRLPKTDLQHTAGDACQSPCVRPAPEAHTEPTAGTVRQPSSPDTRAGTQQTHTTASQCRQYLSVATINIRGFTQALDDVQHILETRSPDVLILTETKRRTTQLHLPKRMHQTYASYCTATDCGSAGVIILVQRRYSDRGTVQQMPVPQACKGYLLHLAITMPHTRTLHVVGTYMPGAPERDENRKAAYSQLTDILQKVPPADTVTISGDWNAALYDSDRATAATPLDKQHRQWMQQHPGLVSAYNHPSQRHPTFSVSGLGASPSMIDDTLLRLPGGHAGNADVVQATITMPHGYNTDHALLGLALDASMLDIPHTAGTDKPGDCQANVNQPTRRLVTPVPKHQQAAFRHKLLAETSHQMQTLSSLLALMLVDCDAHAAAQSATDARSVHKLEVLCDATSD